MTISITRLYDILKEGLGKEKAEGITQFVEQKVIAEVNNSKSFFTAEIRQELAATRLEIEKLRTDMHSTLRNQMWAIIALFIPLYITITIALINLLKH